MSFNRSFGIRDWIYLPILILSMIVILNISSKEFYPADYNEWRKDWVVFKNYIYTADALPFTELSKFTLAYLINSSISNELHKNLLWVNIIFIFIPILCLALTHRLQVVISVGSVFILSLIFSPIPIYYLFSGALEVQSGIVIGVFMSTLAMLTFTNKKDHPKSLLYLLSLSGFILSAYKDTIVVVIAVGYLLLIFFNSFIQSFFLLSKPTKESVIVIIKYGVLPTILGMILSISYNMVKYGVYLPVVYLIESRETSPDVYISLEFLIGSIFSPNGGIIIFWFLPLLIMILGWWMLGFSPQNSVVWLGIICLALNLCGLAKWWAPFGWDSWGNRLAIPSIFGMMVGMLLSLEPTQSKNFFSIKFFKKFKFYKLIFMCLITFLSIYYLSVPYRSISFSAAMQASLNPGPACRNMYRALHDEATTKIGLKFWKSNIYYDCVRERMLHFPTPK